MLEHEYHILPVDLLFDDEQIGDFVKSIQIDSPYQQMLLEGVLTESVRDEKLYVSFTVEGYFHFLLGEVIFARTEGLGAEALKHIVEHNKLNGARGGVEQCLIRDVKNRDLSRLMWIIDNYFQNIDVILNPLISSLKFFGVDDTLNKLFDSPSSNDWAVLNLTQEKLEEQSLLSLRKEIFEKSMKSNRLEFKNEIYFCLNACFELDHVIALNYIEEIILKNEDVENDDIIMYKIAEFYRSKSNNLQVSFNYHLKALQVRLKREGPYSKEISESYGALALVSSLLGNFDDAITYQLMAIESTNNILGNEHSELATCYNNLGLIYTEKGDLESGLFYYEKGFDIFRKKKGNAHHDSAYLNNNLGQLFSYQGNYEKSLEFLFAGVEVYLKFSMDDSGLIGLLYNNIGWSLMGLKKMDESLEFYEKSLSIISNSQGDLSLSASNLYVNIGFVLINKREEIRAQKYLESGLNVRSNILGENHPSVIKLYNDIGIEWDANEYLDLALSCFIQGMNIILKSIGEDYPELPNFYFNIGVCYYKATQYDNSILYFSKGFDIQKTGGYLYRIAECYLALGNKPEALNYLIQSAEIRKEQLGIDDESTRSAIEKSIEIALELNQSEKLPKWIKEFKDDL
jgi:tetratricopeptide (TPR) repeat protein